MRPRDMVDPPDMLEARYAGPDGKSQTRIRVVVTDIDMPISRLAPFVFKLMIAAVPAGMVIWMMWAVLWGLVTLLG